MKKNQAKRTSTATMFAAILAAAFIFASPMTASESFTFVQPEGTPMVLSLAFVPAPDPVVSLADTEISEPARNLPESGEPQIIHRPVTIQPPRASFRPGRRGQGGFLVTVACTVALHAADYWTTRDALQYSTLQEGNPFMKDIVKDPLLFAGVKLGAAGLQCLLLKGLFKQNKAFAWVVGTVMNVALSAVVANNLGHIKKARSSLGY